MKIKINDIEITSRLLEYKLNAQMNSDSLIIGNAVAKQVTMKLDNKDNFMNDKLSYPFIVLNDGVNKTGVFRVFENPEKYTGELTLTLYDNMHLFDQRYNSELAYPTTIYQQIEEMIELTGVNIDLSSLTTTTLSKVVNWYDNTIAMRNYLGWIAELEGCNVFADYEGTIVFKGLASKTYSTIDIESYEKEDEVKFSRVCFDDGLLKLEEGTNDGNTLYLSSNNGYIDSNTSITNIYNKYKDLSFTSVNGVKMANINGWEMGDLINYNNEFIFMLLGYEEAYGGGQYSIATVSGKIDSQNSEIIVNKIDPSVKIRRLQVIADKNNQTLEILAQDLEDGLGEVASLKIEVGKITQATESTNEKVETLKNNLNVSLSTNLPLNQIYETATQLYIPDYTKQNLVITATSTLLDGTIVTSRATYVWKRKTKNGEAVLISGEVANKNVLTVSKNVLSNDKTIDYICYVNLDGREAMASISLALNVQGEDGIDGKDAILVNIDSSNGYMFKNNLISTTLTVSIITGDKLIDNGEKLTEHFGLSAYLQWQIKLFGETEFVDIPLGDNRLSDNGFIFTLNAKDIETKAVFNCILNY